MSRSGHVKDLRGMRFGRVLVTAFARVDDRGQAWWRCRCDCGTEFTTCGHDLRIGGTRSCGCLRRETARRNPACAAVPVRLLFADGTRRDCASLSEAAGVLDCLPCTVRYWCGRGVPFRGAVIERIETTKHKSK